LRFSDAGSSIEGYAIDPSEDTICCTSPQLAEESPPSARRQCTGRDQFSGHARA